MLSTILKVNQLPGDQSVIKIQSKLGLVLGCKQNNGHLGWYWLGGSAHNTSIGDDGLNQSSLCELKTSTGKLLDIVANIVRRVPLVLNLQTKTP